MAKSDAGATAVAVQGPAQAEQHFDAGCHGRVVSAANRAARHPAVFRSGRGRWSRALHAGRPWRGTRRLRRLEARDRRNAGRRLRRAVRWWSGGRRLGDRYARRHRYERSRGRWPPGRDVCGSAVGGTSGTKLRRVEQGLCPVAAAVRKARADAPPRSEADVEPWRKRTRFSDSGSRRAARRAGCRCRRAEEEYAARRRKSKNSVVGPRRPSSAKPLRHRNRNSRRASRLARRSSAPSSDGRP